MSKFKFGINIISYAIVAGFIIDKLPVKIFEDISRDTRFYVLRLLGLQSKVLPSLLIALLLSGKKSLVLESVRLPILSMITMFIHYQRLLPSQRSYSFEELYFDLLSLQALLLLPLLFHRLYSG